MVNLRQIFAGICLLTGLILSGFYMWASHWWGAFGYLCAGFMGSIFLLVGWEIIEEWWYKLMGGGLLIFSIFSVIFESPGIQPNVQQAQLELFQTLLEMNTRSNPLNSIERTLIERATIVCADQGIMDLNQLTGDLVKAQRFGPIMTLIDGLNSTATKKTSKNCLDYYQELRKSQPSSFILFESHNPWVTKVSK